MHDGDICHTTLTGRLSWRISPSGDTLLKIARKSEEIAIRCHLPYGSVMASDGAASVEVVGVFEQRHILALLEALNALMRWDCAALSTASLWALAHQPRHYGCGPDPRMLAQR